MSLHLTCVLILFYLYFMSQAFATQPFLEHKEARHRDRHEALLAAFRAAYLCRLDGKVLHL